MLLADKLRVSSLEYRASMVIFSTIAVPLKVTLRTVSYIPGSEHSYRLWDNGANRAYPRTHNVWDKQCHR